MHDVESAERGLGTLERLLERDPAGDVGDDLDGAAADAADRTRARRHSIPVYVDEGDAGAERSQG